MKNDDARRLTIAIFLTAFGMLLFEIALTRNRHLRSADQGDLGRRRQTRARRFHARAVVWAARSEQTNDVSHPGAPA